MQLYELIARFDSRKSFYSSYVTISRTPTVSPGSARTANLSSSKSRNSTTGSAVTSAA